MMRVITNANSLARQYRQRVQQFKAAVKRGLRRIGVMVNTQQVLNLSGSGSAPPGSYPVPVRSGTLRRGANWGFLSDNVVAVGNTTIYAVPIHEDRPFLQQAGESIDPAAVMAVDVTRAWL